MGLFEHLKEAMRPPEGNPRDGERAKRIAAAVLLLAMAHADNRHESEEYAEIHCQLQAHFGLSRDEADELLAAATPEAESAVSLYDYLKTLNDGLNEAEKCQVLVMLWRVAYADQELDPHEEKLLRDIADLLYLTHEQFLKAKFAVTGESV